MSEQPHKKLSRRDAIKLLGAAAGATMLANLPSKWSTPKLTSGVLPVHAQTSPVLPTVLTVSVIPAQGTNTQFNGDVTDDGGSPILEQGFVWGMTNPPVRGAAGITDEPYLPTGLGSFTVGKLISTEQVTYYVRAYAVNAVGIAYGNPLPFLIPCLVEGTLVTMADGTTKKIEDVNYGDWLSVWNFDEGKFDEAQPLWIKKVQSINQYNLLEFSNGTSLKTVNQHRIFNKEEGMFTYPMTEDTPIGTTTFNARGQEVTLVSKRVVLEQVNYYNIITDRHMNLFADGILTSCRYNNIYPIVDMKFVKDGRTPISREAYDVEAKYYEGLRLAEQTIPVADTIAYVNRLEVYQAEEQGVELTIS